MNTLSILILQSTRIENRKRQRIVRVVHEDDYAWDCRPVENPESVIPFPKCSWKKIDPDQEARAI